MKIIEHRGTKQGKRAGTLLLLTALLVACVNEPQDSVKMSDRSISRVYDGAVATTDTIQDWSDSLVVVQGPSGFCTGLLLSSKVVLTAGHCFPSHAVLFFDFDQYGNSIPDEYNACGPGYPPEWSCGIRIENKFSHPSCSELSIAILEDFAPREGYWNMVSRDYSVDGVDQALAPFQGIGGQALHLLKVGEDCTTMNNFEVDSFVDPGPLQTFFGQQFQFTCESGNVVEGDSGAPVFLQNGELVGVTSRGISGNGMAVYLGYTNSSGMSYVDWIVEKSTISTTSTSFCPHGEGTIQVGLSGPHIDNVEGYTIACGKTVSTTTIEGRPLIGGWYNFELTEPQYQMCLNNGAPLNGIADVDTLELDISCLNEGAVHSAVTSVLL